MGFVSKYIIINKDGSTVEAVKEARDAFNLDLDLYVKPDMNVKQSRDYGFKKARDPWILTQDGDEIFYRGRKEHTPTQRVHDPT